ncbi:peroxidase [Lithospermum erythrorhizon]|uniref:Peroxidase n=1 Tax=Lithospermum erythrorhizon TaxID=34254 RepID=A0AAV3NV48_LITER
MKSWFYFLLFLYLIIVSVIVDGDGDGGDGDDEDRPTKGRGGLERNFYRTSCPKAESLIRDITWNRVKNDANLGARLLRIHYHDCFVKGCDGSILLDTAGNEKSEKEARSNLSLLGFEIIDEIKTEVEKECPGVVSCADIVALAARDTVSYPFQKSMWDVFTGRRDGRISLESDANVHLPSPFANFTSLLQLFASKNLDINDLVALSGAHTIGVAHCGSFSRRLYNFTGKGDIDPSLDPIYGEQLKKICPLPINGAITLDMDPQSSLSFDNDYFNMLTKKKGLFISDAALLTDRRSARIVRQLQSPKSFFRAFAISMINMGAIEVLTGTNGEIRKNCRVVNP